MQRTHRILWGEGMFLRPQHFQRHTEFVDAAIAHALYMGQPHPWGVRSLTIDPEALAGGVIRLTGLNAVFPDGSHVDAPANSPLPRERKLDDIPQIGHETLVYACLPFVNPFGHNCAETDAATARPPRYLLDRAMVPDLYTDALEAEITVLHPNLRLMVSQENRDGQQSLAIARISRNANGTWSLDDTFVPPLVATSASPLVVTLVRRLLDILLVKSQALAATHRERVKSVVEYGTSDIASFWLLHTVNRTYPLLNHYSQMPPHPEALYRLLAQLCGELITFSSSRTLGDIPLYDHEDLTGVFQRLDQLIRELLETVVSNRYAEIPLINTKPSFFVGRLDSERLVENVDYYLSVSGEMAATQILEMAPTKMKIGSPDDVEKILNSALPGVHLVHAQQTPAALPVRVGNHYFILEPQGQIFERMKKARSICIYVPQALLNLKLELLAVFR